MQMRASKRVTGSFGPIFVCLIILLFQSQQARALSTTIDSPLNIASIGSTAPLPAAGVLLSLDRDIVKQLRGFGPVRIIDFPIAQNQLMDLDVHPIRVFAQDARIVVGSAQGDRSIAQPDVVLLGGTVAGSPDSTVFLSFYKETVNGYIELEGHTYLISTGSTAQPRPPVIYDLTMLGDGVIDFVPFICYSDGLGGQGAQDAEVQAVSYNRATAPCRVAQVAIETDWEFTNDLFGGDIQASAAYAATLIAATSEVYRRDFNTSLEMTFLRVWDTPEDPWTQTIIGRQFTQFRNYWRLFMHTVPRNDAHMFSGKNLGGGLGELPGLCQGVSGGYALSANLAGFFPYPSVDFSSQNWDPYVIGHEFGHNFGAPHTHDMNPPVDTCASGACISDGTMMSYCHLCPGGMRNIRLGFHERNVNENILPLIDSLSCDLLAPPVTIITQPQSATVCAGQPVTFTVEAENGSSYFYQWRLNGADITGANQPTFSIASVNAFFAGTYDVVVSSSVCIAVSDPALLIVGEPCPADVTGDCVVDVGDFFLFVALFASGDPAVDFNADGAVDVLDFFAFVSLFNAGCP